MILFLLMTLAAWQDGDQPADPLAIDMAKVSYIIGNQMGKNMKRDKIEIDIDQFLDGLSDAGQDKSKVTDEEMRKIMRDFQTAMRERAKAESKAAGIKNQAEADKFLAENKGKEGVITLESGLQYKVLREGTGKQPTTADKVRTNYAGKLLDGTEFDSSYKRNAPMDFEITRVIPGWTEALLLMKEGAKWELYIPPNLAYGERGSSSIPPNSALIFEVELLEILPPAPGAKEHDHTSGDQHP